MATNNGCSHKFFDPNMKANISDDRIVMGNAPEIPGFIFRLDWVNRLGLKLGLMEPGFLKCV
jgi:hypothetical protein